MGRDCDGATLKKLLTAILFLLTVQVFAGPTPTWGPVTQFFRQSGPTSAYGAMYYNGFPPGYATWTPTYTPTPFPATPTPVPAIILNDSNFNTSVGINSGVSISGIGQENSFYGYAAGKAVSTDTNEAFFGYNSGLHVNGGSYNALFGSQSGYSLTTGSQNTFLGMWAGALGTTNLDDVFVGFEAGYGMSGDLNTGVGTFALNSVSSGTRNIAIGFDSGASNGGSDNVLIGYAAGQGVTYSHKFVIRNNDGDLVNGSFATASTTWSGPMSVVGNVSAVTFVAQATPGFTGSITINGASATPGPVTVLNVVGGLISGHTP